LRDWLAQSRIDRPGTLSFWWRGRDGVGRWGFCGQKYRHRNNSFAGADADIIQPRQPCQDQQPIALTTVLSLSRDMLRRVWAVADDIEKRNWPQASEASVKPYYYLRMAKILRGEAYCPTCVMRQYYDLTRVQPSSCRNNWCRGLYRGVLYLCRRGEMKPTAGEQHWRFTVSRPLPRMLR
jgi:hypothetical protein